ncbi:hypothetical protein WMY93_016068 [Mugilogobius chulae]|uniref:WW domain-containing protein n=1 Tax=Mugilogobius chulae TaxID=88201 RepID=A0AAW0P226_9GOBI
MLQRRRMQTLLSVDDSVEKVYNMLVETGELDNTYIIYTSDHGYHIGQFGLVKGKSMPYEFDIRVPFYVRGPNVEQGAINPHIVLNIDLAPTLLDMAGVDIPQEMDGKSILKLLETDKPVNRFQVNKKPKTWRDSFLVERGKPPHKRADGKEMAQEENFLPKYQRVKDLCQKAEYQTPCQQPGQKWQCVEDQTGKLRLYKCKGMASLYAPRMQALMASGVSKLSPTTNFANCNCADMPFKTSIFKKKRLLTKKKMKSAKTVTRKRWARSVSFELDGDLYAVDLEEGYRPLGTKNSSWVKDKKNRLQYEDDNDEFSGMEVTAKPTTSNKLTAPSALKVTYRCSILMNDTVKCDGGLYKSLQAWKDHKLHIEHEIETLQSKIKNLREVKGHLKKVRPEECQCNSPSYLFKSKEMFQLNSEHIDSLGIPSSKQKGQWLAKEQKRRKKLRKFLKRLQNNDTCSMPGLTCFTHDNHHWQTAPFWTMGPFCACTSANNNTYWCLRTINDTHNFLFCEFATGFLEYFDINTDPYQLINGVSSLDRNTLNSLHQQLMELRGCKGHKQCNPEKGGKERNYFSEYRPVHRRKRPKVKKPSSKSLGQIWEGWVATCLQCEEMAGTGSDWVEILEPRSRERMYVNLITGECGWEPPSGVPVRQADGNQWWELFDPNSGRFYYYNSTGRRTVWHRPQGADIVPLSQLQAMKRSTEAKRAGGALERAQHGTTGSISSMGSQDRSNVLSEEDGNTLSKSQNDPDEATHPELDPTVDSRSQGDGSSVELNTESSKDTQRDGLQRWQPAPGSKAAMLVKVNSMSRSQVTQQQFLQLTGPGKTNTFIMHTSSKQGGQSSQGYKTAPSGKMSVDARHAHHLRKASNGSFSLVADGGHPSPRLHRSQTSTPRPVSPQYGYTAPIYDEPVPECPIYDEPPMDMEIEGAHLYNGQQSSRLTPTHSLQKPKFLQHPTPGSRHRRNPSSSDYSPAGLECIKHMVNIDPKQGVVTSSPVPTRTPSPTCRHDPMLAQIQPQARGFVRERDAGQAPTTLDKKQNWKVLEATVQRAMEARHSRQSSQASQDFPSSTPQPTANYQDSGYSTGPSPSLRRKSRRRVGPVAGAGGRPGSVGSTGELCTHEKLMAEMREVVSRSNTMREVRAVLDHQDMVERGMIPRTRSPANSLRWYAEGTGASGRSSSREDLTSASRSLGRGNPAVNPLEMSGRQKRTYEKVDRLEMSVANQTSLSSPETPGPPSQVGTLEIPTTLDSHKKGMVDGRTASLGPHRTESREGTDEEEEELGCPTKMGIEDWASKHLNMHTQGLFRRRVSIANMLSWNRGSIKKPMLVTSNRTVRKEACEMFKLVQAYMGDRPSRLDRRHCALLIVTKCWDLPGLRDELYVQLVRQTTGNASPRSLAAGWELMAVSLAFFAPSPKFRCYLEGYIQRHTEPTNDKKLTQFILDQQDLKLKKTSKSRKKRKQSTDDEEEGLPISTYAKFCHRKLQKVAITVGKRVYGSPP